MIPLSMKIGTKVTKMSDAKTIFITGSAGFIGYHLCTYLLEKKHTVIGFDAFTNYYDVNLKRKRNEILNSYKNFISIEGDLNDIDKLKDIFNKYIPSIVFHLAAQAGVRHSITNPKSYLDNNLVGTFNLLEIVKKNPIEHFLFASTSSVYGANEKFPFSEIDKADNQISFYAATKKANEVMLHSYSHIEDIPITVFRFFTVYGPWGRPDMALFKFTKLILEDKPIDIYNFGKMKRDFTFINDLIESIYRLSKCIPMKSKSKSDSLSSVAPFRIVNIGNSSSVELIQYINTLEKYLNKKAKKNFLGMQQGDVKETLSNTDLLFDLTNYRPSTTISVGIKKFVDWYIEYHRI